MAYWPSVVAHLIERLPHLDGWQGVKVLDGPPTSGARDKEYLTVGFVEDDDTAGGYEYVPSRVGNRLLDETGTVRAELVLTKGSLSPQSLRDRGFALTDALAQHLRDELLLTVLPAGATVSLSFDVRPIQNSTGTAWRLPMTFSYTAPRT